MISSSAKPDNRPTATSEPPRFDWPLAYEAEKQLREWIAAFLQNNTFARRLADRMAHETGTDFFEWIDHLVLSPEAEKTLLEIGFVHDQRAETPNGEKVYEHPQATLPRVMVRKAQKQNPSIVALRPEFVADFIARHNLSSEPEGEPLSRYRRVLVADENGTQLEAVERRSYRGFVPAPLTPSELQAIIKAKELWATRRRLFENDAEGVKAANQILERVTGLVGRDLACQFYFEAERAYWETRNRAGQIQKRRQDQLGLGWGNHDHHTFRC